MHGSHDSMHVELQVAMNFIISYLYNKLPRTRVHVYGEELEKLLRVKFSGHWYPANPVKGSAFRCVHLNSAEIDPSFKLAAERSGLDFVNDIKSNLPAELSVWVDPGEVSYAIGGPDGKPGPVKVLHKHHPDMNEGKERGNHPNAFPRGIQVHENGFKTHEPFITFNPHAKDFLPKSPEPVFSNEALQTVTQPGQSSSFCYSLRPQRKLYTVDEFASTKFGSTKMRSNARNPYGFQRMHSSPNFSNSGMDISNPSPMAFMPDQQGMHFDSTFSKQEQRPLSLATSSSSFSSEYSSGSSASSSPDHIRGQQPQMSRMTPSSPTSPWGESFTLPSSIYQSVDHWGSIDQGSSNHQQDFISFNGFTNFPPFSSIRTPSAAKSSDQLVQ